MLREKKIYKLNYVKHSDGFYYLLKKKVKYHGIDSVISFGDVVATNNPAIKTSITLAMYDLYDHMENGDCIKVYFKWFHTSHCMIPKGWHNSENKHLDGIYIHYEKDECSKKEWSFLCAICGTFPKTTEAIRINYTSIQTFNN